MSEVENEVSTVVDTSAPVESAAPEAAAPSEPAPKFSESNVSALNDVIENMSKKASSGKGGQKAPIPTATAATTPAELFTPNLKFKVKDKEHEIPAYLKDSIKDAKTEKEIREVFEKAYGLDGVKEDRASLKKERDQFQTSTRNYESMVAGLRADFQRNDMDTFFQKLNIPIERVLQYALQKAQYYDLPPEQRAQIDNKRASDLRVMELESKTQDYQQRIQSDSVAAKQSQLEFTMTRPEISSVEKSFDAQAGKPGAFRQMVINHGELTYARSNGQIDLTPQQAVEQVMELYGVKAGTTAPAATTAATAASATPAAAPAAPRATPTVIPNIQGRSTSPLPAKPRSIADIQKITKEKYG